MFWNFNIEHFDSILPTAHLDFSTIDPQPWCQIDQVLEFIYLSSSIFTSFSKDKWRYRVSTYSQNYITSSYNLHENNHHPKALNIWIQKQKSKKSLQWQAVNYSIWLVCQWFCAMISFIVQKNHCFKNLPNIRGHSFYLQWIDHFCNLSNITYRATRGTQERWMTQEWE